MPTERFQFTGEGGHQLAASLDLPDGEPLAYALFAHCFTCGKDVLAARRIAATLAGKRHRCAAVRLHGPRLQRGRFRQLHFFVQCRRSGAGRRPSCANFEKAPAILIGHSLGGAAVLAAAGQIPDAKAVVTIARAVRSRPCHRPVQGSHRGHPQAGQGRSLARRPALPDQQRIPRRHRRTWPDGRMSPICTRRC